MRATTLARVKDLVANREDLQRQVATRDHRGPSTVPVGPSTTGERDVLLSQRNTVVQRVSDEDQRQRTLRTEHGNLETRKVEGGQRLLDATAQGEESRRLAQEQCAVVQSNALKRRREEMALRCAEGPRVVVEGITFELAEVCSSLLRARPARDGSATAEIRVGTADPVVVNLWTSMEGITVVDVPPRTLTRPSAVLTVGAVRWDLGPYLALTALNDRVVSVTLTVGTDTGTVRLDRSQVPDLCGLSYSMRNGDMDYLDYEYAVDGAVVAAAKVQRSTLAHGRGVLTNGTLAAGPWGRFGALNWVGWFNFSPEIRFVLPRAATTVRIYARTPVVTVTTGVRDVSNEVNGSIYAPTSVLIQNVARTSTTAVALGAVGWLTFPGLTLTAHTDVIVRMTQTADRWIFVSEIVFE